MEQNHILNSKSSKISQNIEKNHIFEIQLWASGRYWPIIGRFVASKVRSIPKSNQNFLFCPDSKIENFVQKNFAPTKNRKNGGGGGAKIIKCCLIQKSLNMIAYYFWDFHIEYYISLRGTKKCKIIIKFTCFVVHYDGRIRWCFILCMCLED